MQYTVFCIVRVCNFNWTGKTKLRYHTELYHMKDKDDRFRIMKIILIEVANEN